MILAEDEKPDPILEEAVDWLLKLRDASPDSEAVRAFDAWVSSSAAHARAWKTARMTWGLMGEAPPVYRHLWDDTAPVHRLPARRRRRTAAAAALASVVLMALVLAFVMPAMMLRFEADHMTTTAENRVVTLEDGSRVTLGAHSAIAADMAGGERR